MNSGDGSHVLLRIHYDGSDFFGWQLQREDRTVQGELEAAVARLTGAPHRVLGSGRTDRGVHATGQCATVTVRPPWTPITLRRALNAVLPADVWVESAVAVPNAFHPRYDAVARTYVYRIGTAPVAASPFHRGGCWVLRRPLDVHALDRSAKQLLGTHSFKSFAKAGQEERGDECRIEAASWREWPGLGIEFEITGNRFLHHMVRYLVGTMVEIASGSRDEGDFEALLRTADRTPDRTADWVSERASERTSAPELRTSPPAPAKGLFLSRVDYPATALARADTHDPSTEDDRAPDGDTSPVFPVPRRDPSEP